MAKINNKTIQHIQHIVKISILNEETYTQINIHNSIWNIDVIIQWTWYFWKWSYSEDEYAFTDWENVITFWDYIKKFL